MVSQFFGNYGFIVPKKLFIFASVLMQQAMKTYKILRGLLKASALTTVMFVMQACYGTPNGAYMPEMSDEEMTMTESDTLVQPLQDVETVSADVVEDAELVAE